MLLGLVLVLGIDHDQLPCISYTFFHIVHMGRSRKKSFIEC